MSRPARWEECNRCQIPILTGTDDYSLPVKAEAVPLTRAGEIHALAAGLDCWRIDADRKLWRTDSFRIMSDAPLPGDHRIAAHVCGQPFPAAWAVIPDHIVITRQPDPTGEPAW